MPLPPKPYSNPKKVQHPQERRDPETGRAIVAYSPEIYEGIFKRIARGESMVAICAEPGMPDWSYVYEKARKEPELGKALAEARAVSAYGIEEQLIAIEDRLASGNVPKEQIRALEVAANNKRWRAGIRNRIYNDKAQQQGVIAIQMNTNLYSQDGGAADPFRLQVTALPPEAQDAEFTTVKERIKNAPDR
jgi:hypothetical protein